MVKFKRSVWTHRRLDFSYYSVFPDWNYGAAKEILRQNEGANAVPEAWQGGLCPFDYRNPARIWLEKSRDGRSEIRFIRANNVIGTFVGSKYPGRVDPYLGGVPLWMHGALGATDPNSGSGMMLTLAWGSRWISEKWGKLPARIDYDWSLGCWRARRWSFYANG